MVMGFLAVGMGRTNSSYRGKPFSWLSLS
jgi:hypothetical protein